MELLWELRRSLSNWPDTKSRRHGALDTTEVKRPHFCTDVMTEDIGGLNLWGRHVSAKARRPDDPNKSACDPHGLGSLTPLILINIGATDWWKVAVLGLSKPS